ncbi:hypothetical protein EUTSA_v10023140mg [Eutrema salsugineum]|uniref:Ubiquitin-like protease family profile domain-containing protein n=2 Tax=Eutrema salsugineum TaxID=72664 RepID=V4M3S7_EUTSA|nr:hypothetical protein EUTSA_v10023140mg [Eutrema salsugineum]
MAAFSSEVGETNEIQTEGQDDGGLGERDGGDHAQDNGDEGEFPQRGKRARVHTSFNDFHVDPKWVSCTLGSHPFICHPDKQSAYFTKFSRLHGILQNYRLISLGSGISVNNKEVLEISDRTKPMMPKMMDAFLLYARAVYVRHFSKPQLNKIVFLETKFTTALMKSWKKFSQVAVKDRHRFKFGDCVMDHLEFDSVDLPPPERLYLPFNFDRDHWVDIAVDTIAGTMTVIDCNCSLRMDGAIKKELAPMSLMFPHVLRQSSANKRVSKAKPFSIHRPKGIPQNSIMSDSGVTTALLIMFHSVGGIGSLQDAHTREDGQGVSGVGCQVF